MYRDLLGRRLRNGDCVMRRRTGEPEDPFQCHRASFGVIEGFVEETGVTRPSVMNVKSSDSWTEILIRPFSDRMTPVGDSRIQWTPAECIKIGTFGFWVLMILWPITRLFHREALEGQSTDW